MKKIARLFVYISLFLALSITVLLPQTIQAETTDLPRLYDYADILTDNEESLLESNLQSISTKNKVDVVTFTINQTDGSDLDYYTETLKEQYAFSDDIVILIVNMDPYNREVLIQGYGSTQSPISSKRAQYITDSMVSNMKAGNYYKGILQYSDKVDYFLNHKRPIATPPQIIIEIAASLVLAAIVVFIMVHNAGGRDTTTCATYMDPASSKILAKQDIYTHTTTTRHKIESNSSSGGGGGGGGHSSGRSSF